MVERRSPHPSAHTPAWKAYREGLIDRASYARRIATYCRSGGLICFCYADCTVYESHLMKVVQEKGRMDVSQSETAVQDLVGIEAVPSNADEVNSELLWSSVNWAA